MLLRALPFCLSLLVAAAPAAGQDERGVAPRAEPQDASAGYARRHALVVGIDEYQDPGYPDLGYAAADARAVARILVERLGFATDDVRLILNGDASGDAVRAELEALTDPDRVGEQDLVVVFFAGHGVTRSTRMGDEGYLVPADGGKQPDGDPAYHTLLGMRALDHTSGLLPAKHALFVLDCCFGGGLTLRRSAGSTLALLASPARQVLAAGGPDQTVDDGGGGGHSVFTAALLDALEGAADNDGDGAVSFGELSEYVTKRVTRETVGKQIPHQGNLTGHEGGILALFPPDWEPKTERSAAERLTELERSVEDQLQEIRRLSDVWIARKLEERTVELWPRTPDRILEYRTWLGEAEDVLSRLPVHRTFGDRLRQEEYLRQLVEGLIPASAGEEPDWERADAVVQWQHDTLEEILERLGRLPDLIADIEARLKFAETIEQRSLLDLRDEWAAALADVAADPRYGFELAPQLGLVPLEKDPLSGLWEFWDVGSGERPARDRETGRYRITGETGVVLVLLPGGTFTMGAQAEDPEGPNYDPYAKPNQGPPHPMPLDPFFLSKYELTQGQWQRFMGDNPSYWQPAYYGWMDRSVDLEHPVELVTWAECIEALRRMGLVLPTEAQWEYGARAGTDTIWWTGAKEEDLQYVANLADLRIGADVADVTIVREAWDDGYWIHAPVGSFEASGFGLHDVYGNVWEWCLDEYGRYGWPVRDGDGLRLAPPEGGRKRPHRRGGGYMSIAEKARSAWRDDYAANGRDRDFGLRPARPVVTD